MTCSLHDLLNFGRGVVLTYNARSGLLQEEPQDYRHRSKRYRATFGRDERGGCMKSAVDYDSYVAGEEGGRRVEDG